MYPVAKTLENLSNHMQLHVINNLGFDIDLRLYIHLSHCLCFSPITGAGAEGFKAFSCYWALVFHNMQE